MQLLSDQMILVVTPSMLCPACGARLRAQLEDRPAEPARRTTEPTK